MKPDFECIRCILSTRLREIEESNLERSIKLEIAKELIRKIHDDFKWDIELTKYVSSLFKYIVTRTPGIIEYYRVIKQISNRIASENISVHLEYISTLNKYDKFKYLVKLSAIANLIDYGVADHRPLDQSYISPKYVESFEIYVDDTRRLYEIISKKGLRVIWLFDNAGEAVYDMLLIKELREIGNEVYALVKEDPGFQNDLTVSDLKYIDVSNAINEFYSYGNCASTIHLDSVNKDILDLINKSNLIIAKGMSHFEYLYEEVDLDIPIVFILIPKCNPVARRIGEGSRGKIVVLLKTPRSQP